MTPEQFHQTVFATFNKRITDEIFVMVQEDRELMRMYLDQVGVRGIGAVNRDLGKAIKREYHLENSEQRQGTPRSTLIQSHQEFE